MRHAAIGRALKLCRNADMVCSGRMHECLIGVGEPTDAMAMQCRRLRHSLPVNINWRLARVRDLMLHGCKESIEWHVMLELQLVD